MSLDLALLIRANRAQLNILKSFMEKIDSDLYKQYMPAMGGASIGKHVRHILDMYRCIAETENTGCLCYDTRTRDSRIEESIAFAIGVMEDIELWFSRLGSDRQIMLNSGQLDDLVTLNTSVSRELLYAQEHTIHHLAIIRIALPGYGVEHGVPEEFGVAPSTLKYNMMLQ